MFQQKTHFLLTLSRNKKRENLAKRKSLNFFVCNFTGNKLNWKRRKCQLTSCRVLWYSCFRVDQQSSGREVRCEGLRWALFAFYPPRFVRVFVMRREKPRDGDELVQKYENTCPRCARSQLVRQFCTTDFQKNWNSCKSSSFVWPIHAQPFLGDECWKASRGSRPSDPKPVVSPVGLFSLVGVWESKSNLQNSLWWRMWTTEVSFLLKNLSREFCRVHTGLQVTGSLLWPFGRQILSDPKRENLASVYK